jgi:hypothetical protein
VRFLGRAWLERSFITLDDARLLVACLAQLERADEDPDPSLIAHENERSRLAACNPSTPAHSG